DRELGHPRVRLLVGARPGLQGAGRPRLPARAYRPALRRHHYGGDRPGQDRPDDGPVLPRCGGGCRFPLVQAEAGVSRYVRFARKHQVAALEAEGWRISDDLGGTHHGEWSVIMEKDCGMTASEIATKAAEIMSGDRARTHGDKRKNHENIAALWNAFLAIRREPAAPLSGSDVALMVGLLKIARTQLGD